jgi:small subunit ribosomal protein S16
MQAFISGAVGTGGVVGINCICDRNEGCDSTAEPRVRQSPLLVHFGLRRWIVVAGNRKNLKGRFVEHVGYWSPRQGVALQRQIVMNVPRVKYWISCGAVPTDKVQKFLSLWSILPKPWFQQRSEEELAALRKPEAEWTDKDRMKEERKRKRREREKMSAVNYHRRESMYKGEQYGQLHKYKTKLREKIHAAERENQILRELLLHNEFHKLNRINELAGHVVYDDSEELARLEAELAKAKAELALLDRTFKDTTVLHKIKAMQEINKLVDKIREVERERQPFRKRNGQAAHEDENITQFQLDKKLEYELVTRKIEKMNQDFAQLDTRNFRAI